MLLTEPSQYVLWSMLSSVAIREVRGTFTSMRSKLDLRSTTVFALTMFLLGCSQTLQVEAPNTFHGKIRLLCGDLVGSSGSRRLTVGTTGELTNVHCPSRQTHVQVVRPNGTTIDVSGTWVTTGDGIVREITFDVP